MAEIDIFFFHHYVWWECILKCHFEMNAVNLIYPLYIYFQPLFWILIFYYYSISSDCTLKRSERGKEKKNFPLYVWDGFQFLLLSLKPINFFLYVWKISKYFKLTSSVKYFPSIHKIVDRCDIYSVSNL